MSDHDDLEALLGIDTDDADYALAKHLASEDDNLLETLVMLRKTKGLTQKQVAERMNRDPSAVSKFETLGADPHLSTIRRYASAVGAKFWHVVEDADQSDSTPGDDEAIAKLRSLKSRYHRPGSIIAFVHRDQNPGQPPRHGIFEEIASNQALNASAAIKVSPRTSIADLYQITNLHNGRMEVRLKNDKKGRGDRVDA